MASVDTAKIIQGLTVLTISLDLPLMAKHCKSCKISVLSLQLNMDQMGDTAAQRSKLIHYLIRLCATILAAWLIAAWSNELLVNLFVSHKIG
jgi:hypothetical protein